METRALTLAALVLSASAAAQEVDANTTTVLSGRPEARDGEIRTLVPVWEILSLRLRQATAGPIEDLRLVVQAWGQVTEDATQGELVSDGDVDVAYAEGTLLHDRVRFRAGRQLLAGGSARMMGFDGLWLDGRIIRGLGVQVAGGAPVTPRFGTHRGDALASGRIYWRQSIDAEIGASYLYVLDQGRTARSDLGLDGRVALSRNLSLAAFGLWSAYEERLAEANLTVSWAFAKAWFLTLDVDRTAPDLFLPRSSILSVFSQETRDEGGGSATWRIGHARLQADYHLISDEIGIGHRAAARGELLLGKGGLAGLELRLLELPTNGYQQVRLYGRARLTRRLTGTLDLDLYVLDQELDGTRVSLSSTCAVAWEAPGGWRIVGSGVAAMDPLYERRFEVMVKAAHDFSIHLGGVR